MSLVALAFRMLFSLGLVVGLMVLANKWLRNRGASTAAAKRRSNLPLEVIARQRFGRNSQVAVLHAAGRELVVGVTENGISLLASVELDADGMPVQTAPAVPAAAMDRSVAATPAGAVSGKMIDDVDDAASESAPVAGPDPDAVILDTLDPADVLLFELPDAARTRDATRTASPALAPALEQPARKTTLDALRERTVRRSAS